MRLPQTCLKRLSLFKIVQTAVILLLACVSTSLMFAQLSGKGAISGTVTDNTGAVITNAVVTITNDATGLSVRALTTSSGFYEATTLDAGIYTVTTEAPGFSKIVQQNVHINTADNHTYNPSLTAGATSETVTVTAEPPTLQTGNATLATTMEQDMYSALPIQMGAGSSPDQRRATDFVALMPGVQATTINPTISSGSVGGSPTANVSAIYVNGVPFTYATSEGDPRFVWSAISVDSVDQFQVQTAGYPALYEGQGVQSYTVKAGGNKIHGSLFEYFRNTVLDTWGFYAPSLTVKNPVTGVTVPAQKPAEHMNEFGGLLSGPLWKNKMFLFADYDMYRFSHGPFAALQTLPTQAEYGGNFTDQGVDIYDPTSTVCDSTGTHCIRNKYTNHTVTNINPVSQYLQHFLPSLYTLPTITGANFIGGYRYGLVNWTVTSRYDWVITSKNSMSLVFGKGRQATVGGPAVQSASTGRNVTPFAPYNYGQEYAPLTTVWVFTDTYTFTPHLLNQFVYGYGRYTGPSFNPNAGGAFAATQAGISGLPPGQASEGFPPVTFAGSGAPPTNWAGALANTNVSNHFDMIDNVQWQKGGHSLTFGGQLGWIQYQDTFATGGTTPLTLAASNSQTQGFKCATGATGTCTLANSTTTLDTATGLPYASFLAGAFSNESLTQYIAIETGARFRPLSFYGQDDWKVNSRLTVNLGLRWDFFPSYREAQNRLSWLNPTATNPVTGNLGITQFAGSTAVSGACNCSNAVNNYMKNFGPRGGFAYQLNPTTVLRGSAGIMFTHGNAIGGGSRSATGTGTLGYSAPVSNAFVNTQTYSGSQSISAGFPAYAIPSTTNTYGVGFTTVAGFTGNPQSLGYGDSYLGGRAPEYVNWSMGFQHGFSSNLTLTMSYVGAEGHFLAPSGSARGYWANQLAPQYLVLGSLLSASATPANIAAAGAIVKAPNGYSVFDPKQSIATYYRAFPQYAVSDSYGYVSNSIYNGLQTSLIERPVHGLNFMLNFTWAKSLDNAGTFRAGYAIPAQYSADGRAWPIDRLDRSVSTIDQAYHVVLTIVYDLPFGKGDLGGNSKFARALLANYKFSAIYQGFTGAPLAVTGSDCGVNAANQTCVPLIAPGYVAGKARINGGWGHGSTANSATSPAYIDINAFTAVPSTAAAPLFSTTARTAPLALFGPGNYDIDISLRRSFSLEVWGMHLLLQGDLYNLTNHTQFGGISTAWSTTNTSFGKVTAQSNSSRDAQLAAKIEF
jgi:hypothetical protein